MAVKPGERRLQILQVLAEMLEDPKGEKITTAGLAKRLDCSEAALYRHFASKAQMYEGLIDFIESSLFGVINQIAREEADPLRQIEMIVALLLRFAARNRGMTRVLIGEALVNEDARLQARINQLTDKIEATLRQCLKVAATAGRLPPNTDTSALANLMLCYAVGRWHGYAKSGFAREPAAQWPAQWPLLLAAATAVSV
jgi:TetR/AcrR family transcriptional regulator